MCRGQAGRPSCEQDLEVASSTSFLCNLGVLLATARIGVASRYLTAHPQAVSAVRCRLWIAKL